MTNKKTFIALLVVLTVVIISGVYWWQSNDTSIQVPISEVTQPQKTSEEPSLESTTDEGTKNQEIKTDTTWKPYTSNEGKISFEYPQQFFLLDRSKDDRRIYISSREISFNDFANGYYEPIEISFKDESESNSMIEALESKKVSQININGRNALVISGVVPENSPYYASEVFAIFFPEQEISIVVANRFNQDNITDLAIIARKIATTLTFE